MPDGHFTLVGSGGGMGAGRTAGSARASALNRASASESSVLFRRETFLFVFGIVLLAVVGFVLGAGIGRHAIPFWVLPVVGPILFLSVFGRSVVGLKLIRDQRMRELALMDRQARDQWTRDQSRRARIGMRAGLAGTALGFVGQLIGIEGAGDGGDLPGIVMHSLAAVVALGYGMWLGTMIIRIRKSARR